MPGLRIENKPLLTDVSPANLATHAGAAKKRFPELTQFIDQLQKTINSIVVSAQQYKIGELPLVKLLNATGKQIGWFGVNGTQDGAALQALRAYEDGAHLGTGRLTAPAQISAGATNLLTVGTDDQVQVFDFAAGGGSYTYNIDLDKTNAFEGAIFYLKITKAASANPTVVIRNGSAGAVLATLNSPVAENYNGYFVFDGTNWIKFSLTNAGSVPPSEFNSVAYNFPAQSPGGSLVVGSNTITLSPVPSGVNGSNTSHYLYISGGVGAAEAVLITGGSAASGAASGTITFTCANTHSGAWTIRSASSGIQEAIWDASNPGVVAVAAGLWPVYGTITKPAALQVDIVGAGSASTILAAQFASGNVLYVDGNSGPRIVRGLQFQPALVRSSGAELYTTGIIDGTVDDIFVTGSQPYIGIVAENFIRTRHGNLKVVNSAFRGLDLRVLAGDVAGGEFSDVNITAASGSPAAITFTVGASGVFAGVLLGNIGAQGGEYNVYLDNTAGTINELQFSNLQIDSASVTAFHAGGTGSANGLNISNVRVSPVSGGKPFYIGKTYSDVTIANVTGAKVGNVNGIEIDGATGVHLSDFSMDGSSDAGAADAGVNITANSGTPTTNVTLSGVSCGRRNPPTYGLAVSGNAHVGLRIDNSEFFGTTPILDQNTNKTAYANVLVGSGAPSPLYTLQNYIATESGANNAIAATFGGAALQDGLTLTVKLAHTLQAGANTFNLNGGGAVSIKSSRNPANDIGTAYAATGTITLRYDSTGPYWLDASQ